MMAERARITVFSAGDRFRGRRDAFPSNASRSDADAAAARGAEGSVLATAEWSARESRGCSGELRASAPGAAAPARA